MRGFLRSNSPDVTLSVSKGCLGAISLCRFLNRVTVCGHNIMVRITDLVLIVHIPEKIKFQPTKKHSSTIPGSWMIPGLVG